MEYISLNMITTCVLSLLAMLVGLQILPRELRLLTGRYNYAIQRPQWVTFVATVIALAGAGCCLYKLSTAAAGAVEISAWTVVGGVVLALLPLAVFVVGEWVLSKVHTQSVLVAWGWRAVLCLLLQLSPLASPVAWISYVAVGLFLRTSPFGIPFCKDLCLACYMHRRQSTPFEAMLHTTSAERELLPATEYAGRKRTADETQMKRYNVAEFGILPNTSADSLDALQHLVDQVGISGGGIIYFPRGRYCFNKGADRFLAINYSNIIIEGEVDGAGRPLATLVNCGRTSRGHKNPWISPFFITTGEALQPSNEFWGLQMRRRSDVVMRSNSLSDPGSDGSIMSPEVTAHVTASAAKGTRRLTLDDTQKVGRYILLGLYNTTPDGNLIRDILGVDELREEWTVARRAGAEEAPSYQWLIEVERIIDDHTIELVRPLLRDVPAELDPVVCNAEMLEHITVRNLQIESTWNGQFRHHGFPLYYNISRTQEMDYGWNAINMKRCAHSEVSNVVIRNFSNPLYVLDSRSVTVSGVTIEGYDGHQGLKAYMHTCDCLFTDITFRAHFADMMGGEGPAYANVFRRISYENPVFAPVDYDFHGFASEPMSPPSDNMFTHVSGFRYFKAAGSLSHMPSLARRNVWWEIATEGERRGDFLFFAMSYREKKGLLRIVYAVGYAVAKVQKAHKLSPRAFVANVRSKLKSIDEVGFERRLHRRMFFVDNHVYGLRTTGLVD